MLIAKLFWEQLFSQFARGEQCVLHVRHVPLDLEWNHVALHGRDTTLDRSGAAVLEFGCVRSCGSEEMYFLELAALRNREDNRGQSTQNFFTICA